MHNAVMCTLSLYDDVIGIKRHLQIKVRSFSNIAQPLHKEAVRGCSFLFIIAKKSLIMSEAFLVDVSIIFVCTDSTEIFFSKLRSAGLNYNLPSFFFDSYCAGGI